MHRMDGSRAKRCFAQSCWHGCLSAHIVPSRNRASVVMRKEGMSNGACKKHYISKPRRCISNFGKVYISVLSVRVHGSMSLHPYVHTSVRLCLLMSACACFSTSVRPYIHACICPYFPSDVVVFTPPYVLVCASPYARMFACLYACMSTPPYV